MISSDHLAPATISPLLNIYQELEKHESFHTSPQEVHLRHTIGKFFEMLSSEDKILISKQFQPQHGVWCALEVSNLPTRLRRSSEAIVLDNLKRSIFDVFESPDATQKDINNLIQAMNVAATCSFFENNEIIEEYLVKLWSKTCHKNGYIQLKDFDTVETVWYFEYLEALVSLTECTRIQSNKGKCKVLHNMSSLLCNCSTETLILLFNLFCTLTFNGVDDEPQHVIDSNFKDTCRDLLQGVETSTRPYLLRLLAKYKFSESFHEVTSTMFHEHESLMQEWNMNCDTRNKFKSTEWKKQLIQAAYLQYTHKCFEVTSDICIEPDGAINSAKSNFDLGNVLFDDSDSEEPSRKKAKLDFNDTGSLIERLENDTLLLCQVEATTLSEHKERITDVINKLRNIVS